MPAARYIQRAAAAAAAAAAPPSVTALTARGLQASGGALGELCGIGRGRTGSASRVTAPGRAPAALRARRIGPDMPAVTAAAAPAKCDACPLGVRCYSAGSRIQSDMLLLALFLMSLPHEMSVIHLLLLISMV